MLSVSDGAAGVAHHHRKLAGILCADIAGFSRLMGEAETETYEALSRLRGAVDPLIAAHRGRIVSTAGDGLLADFASVVDAMSCAVEMQDASRRLNEPLEPSRRLEMRIGVNLGDVIVAEDGDLYGDGVNIAARLETLALPGGICLSQPVFDQVKSKLAFDYRPLGAVRVKNIAEPVRAYSVSPGVPVATRRVIAPRHRPIAAICGVAVVGAGLLVWLLAAPLGRESSVTTAKASPVAGLAMPSRLAERISVAVLPFKNLSSDADQQYLTDGITEDIINALGRFSNLLVAAKSASFQFKGRDLSPQQLGRDLGVRYLVGGSMRRAGDEVRITVELTNAATGFQLWSDTYNAKLKDIFALQDQITQRIVGLTAVKLTRLERERVLRKPTANLAAYELVLRGRAGLSDATRAANDEARTLFEQAVHFDPDYAAAYAALGWTHYEAVVSGWTEFTQDDLSQSETLAQKALALDPATTNAYRLLAEIAVFHGDYDRALQDIDRAVALNPSDAENFQVRGYILLWSGKASEAVPWLEGALRLDGADNVAALQLGIAKYFLGQYPDAVDALVRALAGDPARIILLNAHPVLAATYARQSKQAEAESEHTHVLSLSPFFDAERFAAQFGTQQARDDMLAGLKAAGFQ